MCTHLDLHLLDLQYILQTLLFQAYIQVLNSPYDGATGRGKSTFTLHSTLQSQKAALSWHLKTHAMIMLVSRSPKLHHPCSSDKVPTALCWQPHSAAMHTCCP